MQSSPIMYPQPKHIVIEKSIEKWKKTYRVAGLQLLQSPSLPIPPIWHYATLRDPTQPYATLQDPTRPYTTLRDPTRPYATKRLDRNMFG